MKVDLGRVFEKGAFFSFVPFVEAAELRSNIGQSYVALSRAASMEGLQVLRFDPNRVCCAFFSDLSYHGSGD